MREHVLRKLTKGLCVRWLIPKYMTFLALYATDADRELTHKVPAIADLRSARGGGVVHTLLILLVPVVGVRTRPSIRLPLPPASAAVA